MTETLALVATGATSRIWNQIRTRLDLTIVRYDAWWLVLLAVLLVLAFVYLTAMSIWCLTHAGGKRFSGNWT